MNAAFERITVGRVLSEKETYRLSGGGRVVVQGVYESDRDDADCEDTVVGWNAKASCAGAGATVVPTRDLWAWLALRWPASRDLDGFLQGGGFGRVAMGRRPKAESLTELVQLRISKPDLARVAKQAAVTGETVPQWIRRNALAALGGIA